MANQEASTIQPSFFTQLKGLEQERVILAFVLIVIAILGSISAIEEGNIVSLLGNLATELAGAVFTFVVFQFIIDQRDKRKEEARLIDEMGSTINDIALIAVKKLRKRGQLEDGTLAGVDFWHANLAWSNLQSVNLTQARLWWAHLEGAILWEANLSGAHLIMANLSEAQLLQANLAGADLTDAILVGADLANANLAGADLVDADLVDANLAGAHFDENTILPDRTKWTPDTDLIRFVYRQHANFWRSDNPLSPAYRHE